MDFKAKSNSTVGNQKQRLLVGSMRTAGFCKSQISSNIKQMNKNYKICAPTSTHVYMYIRLQCFPILYLYFAVRWVYGCERYRHLSNVRYTCCTYEHDVRYRMSLNYLSRAPAHLSPVTTIYRKFGSGFRIRIH